MNQNQEPQTVVVTGANRGIGYAIAEDFVSRGHRVAGLHRSGQVPEGAFGAVADMTDSDSVNAAIKAVEEELGPVQVLVANAGANRDMLMLRMSEADFSEVLDVNLTGAFRCVKAVTKSMIRQRYGRIVLMSSVVGLHGSPGQVNYAAAKSGLVGMARSITRELGGRGITANVVAPGFIETAMTAELPPQTQERYLDSIPVGRFGAVQDVAGAVAFLAAPTSGYISGAVLPVDGGLGMGH